MLNAFICLNFCGFLEVTISNYSNLPRACAKISKNDKISFYEFLEERFNVEFYDELYNVITKINIKSILATNIDNLFYKIYANPETEKGLCNRAKGKDNKNNLAVDYYALHGSIKEKGEYVFGVTDLASAFSRSGTKESWRNLARDSSKNPILFWGWNFSDPGPIEAMYDNESEFEENIQRWVLLHEPNDETIDFLESLRFNIIIGDTKEMLAYINSKCSEIAEELEVIIHESGSEKITV